MYIVVHGCYLNEHKCDESEYWDIETSNWREALHSYKKVKAFYDSESEYVSLRRVNLNDDGDDYDFETLEDIYSQDGYRKGSW